jgi:hypothetical protein
MSQYGRDWERCRQRIDLIRDSANAAPPLAPIETVADFDFHIAFHEVTAKRLADLKAQFIAAEKAIYSIPDPDDT